MKQLTKPNKALLIFAPGSSTNLVAAKIHQMLSDTEHTILNLQQLMRHKTEVMLAWKIFNSFLLNIHNPEGMWCRNKIDVYRTQN